MSTAAERLDGVYRSRSNLESRLLMDRTAHQINLAAAGGPGHQVLIELPGRLNHTFDYSLDVNSTGSMAGSMDAGFFTHPSSHHP